MFTARPFLARLALVSALALAAPAFAADEIPVDRVILSTSGLADFELKATVKGNAALEFPVRLTQVDDILKSLVVFDSKGRLGGVTLPGKQPLAEVFKDLPFSQTQLSNPMMLLNAYQGAELNVQGAALKATGKIIRVAPETTALKDGQTITRHRLTLLTSEGMKQAVLEDLESFALTEDKPKAEIARALEAVRENASSDRRLLTVNLEGPKDSNRDVRLAYVVDAPLWKSAYRMVLPSDDKKDGLLQGWAVIENMTAGDWDNVDLTLVSGNPVTYRQALYESYYVARPEIPVQVFGRVMPRVDTGTIATADFAEVSPSKRLMKAEMMERGAPAPMAMAESRASYAGGASSMDSIAQMSNAAESSEATTQVLFRFPTRFSLKSGQSMMLPFSSGMIPMRKVALYQPETHATHPLAAVELENKGATGLPSGILTLYEDGAHGAAFVGDAQLPMLAKGEKRLVSYALDSKTDITQEQKSSATEDRITISQGVMRTSVVSREETDYIIKAPASEPRTVILERPKLHDYTVVTPDPKDVEITDTHYRLTVPVNAGETKKATLVLERQMWQSISLVNMPTHELLDYAKARGKLSPDTRDLFKTLAAARREVDAIDQQINETDRLRNDIFRDQERVRENLKSLEGKSNIKDKYLEKLEEQEDQITGLEKQRNKLSNLRAEKIKDLQKLIAEIKI